MNKNIYFLVFCLLTLGSGVKGQDFNRYERLKCGAPIPEQVKKLSGKSYEEKAENITRDQSRFERKAKDRFYLSSTFRTRKLLLSGRVLFHDTLTNYVEKVADEVLKDQPELRKKLNFYIVKSSVVNGFATNDGMIFLTMGMLAQLTNEAQLAFIISHEAIHFRERHVLDSYVEKERITKHRGAYKNVSQENSLMVKNKYSKELEKEADFEGFEIFKQTDYIPDAAFETMEILKYSYLPVDEVAFDKSYYETENMVFPDGYALTSLNPIALEKDYDEEKSTHPSVEERKEYLIEKINNVEQKDKSEFLVATAEEFATIRKIAKYELASILLDDFKLEEALYHTYILLQENPKDIYPAKVEVKALYYLTKYAYYGDWSKVVRDYEKVEGQSQQLSFLLYEMRRDEINVIALRKAWDLYEREPDDSELKEVCLDLMREMYKNGLQIDDFFSRKTLEELRKEIDEFEQDTVDVSELSKIEKIKYQQKVTKTENRSDSNIKWAFAEELSDSDEFVDLMKKAKDTYDDDSNSEDMSPEKKKRIKRHGYSLDIDKVLFVNPQYVKIDQRKDNSIQHLDAEESQLKLYEVIRESAGYVGIKTKILDDNELNQISIDEFNDLIFLKTWMHERAVFLQEDITAIPFSTQKRRELSIKYDTDHFCWAGFYGVRIDETLKKVLTLAFSMVYFPTLPYGIYYAIRPAKKTFHYTILFNIMSGEVEWARAELMDKGDANDLINSMIYDDLHQMNKKH